MWEGSLSVRIAEDLGNYRARFVVVVSNPPKFQGMGRYCIVEYSYGYGERESPRILRADANYGKSPRLDGGSNFPIFPPHYEVQAVKGRDVRLGSMLGASWRMAHGEIVAVR